MSKVMADLKYTKEHEWVKKLSNGNFQVGITDYAQSSLGDIVFVDVPGEGTTVKQGTTVGTIESVKAVSDIYSPLDGSVVSKNSVVSDDPASVNADPYVKAWLLEIKATDVSQYDALLSAADYEAFLDTLH
ncbi:MAG: glycine cleavage system protein GcvH [Spirochaetia bacterium]|nr:glycine cleavage system protein GcvH [Spirochaetia bacterium]